METIEKRAMALAVASGLVLGSACGGGGPGVRGVEAQQLFSELSAEWVLDTIASEEMSPDSVGPEAFAGRGRAPGRGGGPPGGGAGMPPGGGRPGRGGPPPGMAGPGGGAGAMDPEQMAAMQATMALARSRPDRIYLEADDSTFSVRYSPGPSMAMSTLGDEVELEGARPRQVARVAWDGRIPRLERSIDGGGKITDRFELVTHDRLLVTRKVEAGLAEFETRFVYDRHGG